MSVESWGGRREGLKNTDTSARRDLRLRNGTRKNESEREKKPIKKMIHSETKFSFIFKD